MRHLLAGTFLLFGALVCAQQQAAPQLPPGTTPPTFPQPDKDVGREMPPDTKAKEPSAMEVQQQIQKKIDTEPGLANAQLKVKVSNSAVLLSGSVKDAAQHQAARRIAESYAGPRRIEDKIQIRP